MRRIKKFYAVMFYLILIIGLSVATPFSDSMATEYTITGGQFETSGDPWLITGGSMSWELYDILPHGLIQRGVYGVTGYSIEVLDPLGMVHTLDVVPDGLPSPYVHHPEIPDIIQDSGIVNVFSDGFLDMIIYDLSIDGQPVDQSDIIGGPAFVGSSWVGVFPQPNSFSVDMLAGINSLNLFGDVFFTGEASSVPEPSTWLLLCFGLIGIVGVEYNTIIYDDSDIE